MIKLYFAPRTRAARVLWLLEELRLEYELVEGEFVPPAKRFFGQSTPLGKYPTLVDGEITMCESGAILEYLLEKYGDGRLQPPIGTPARAAYLQWFHYAESTAFPPLGILIWLSRYREDGNEHENLISDTMGRAGSGFEFLENHLKDHTYLAGDDFTAADIMMGFTLLAAMDLGVVDDTYPETSAYLGRLAERPALQKVMGIAL